MEGEEGEAEIVNNSVGDEWKGKKTRNERRFIGHAESIRLALFHHGIIGSGLDTHSQVDEIHE